MSDRPTRSHESSTESCLGDFVGQWARVSPEQTALVQIESGKTLSYAQLSERGWRWANLLRSRGVVPGDRVALLAKNGLETFEVLVACLRIGAAFTPLNWRLAPAELAGILTHAQPRCLLFDADFATQARALCGDLGLDGIEVESDLGQTSDAAFAAALTDETLAMLLYTSGTTGKPKGVMVPHRQLFWNAINTVHACDLSPADRVLACLPLFHTGGLNCLATPALYRGGTVVLTAGFDAPQALQIIEEHRITGTVAVPTMYQMLLDAGLDERDTTSLRFLLCGGAPCPAPLLEAYLSRGAPFRQGFGMTEVGPNCFSLPTARIHEKPGSVGQPVHHGEAAIFDEDGQPVAVGEVGELCLRGPHVSAGYWNDPKATSNSRRGDWFRTGDGARMDADGFFYVAGRKKDMFISGGENVYPAEVEAALLGHPDIAEVAVIGVPDERWGEVGVAAIVVRPGAPLKVETLRAWSAERLAKFKVPKRFVALPELPKNASGKVVKPAIRAQIV